MGTQGDLNELSELIADARRHREETRREAEALLARANEQRALGPRAFWLLGRTLLALKKPRMRFGLEEVPLARVVRERIGIPPTRAWKILAVAEELDQATAERLGLERAYAIIAVARATKRQAAALIATDAPVEGRPLSTLSVRALHQAVAAHKARHPRRAMRAVERKAKLRALAAVLRPLGVHAKQLVVSPRGVRIALDWTDVDRLARRAPR